MAPPKLSLGADEELAKKDDDHRPQTKVLLRPQNQWKIPLPRRLVVTLASLGLLYLFFKNMPTDLPTAAERYNPELARLQQQNHHRYADSARVPAIPKAAPSQQRIEKEGLVYDGKVKFYELAQSLPSSKHPEDSASHAVAIAASSLHSASDLLPLACRMARRRLNNVHFVLMGKDEISIEGIKQVNGIQDSECPMAWHDSRPDYASQSTDARMERSVAGGLELIQDYIRPEVIITQGKEWEDSFFWTGLKAHTHETGLPHVCLPTASRDLMWISSLDSTALRAWNDLHVDMVVHAPSELSGSLIRLLRSLDAADYLGATPSLTIELPSRVDAQLLRFLQRMDGLPQLSGRVTIRRRVQQHAMDSDESSLRTVEAFYPRDPGVNHLLLLSPQTELSPSFYHYVKYTILHYKQSTRNQPFSSKLLGISLELPTLHPTIDSEPFTPPSAPIVNRESRDEQEFLPSFLWQVPNSNAALYFGDKWAEFHSFLSNRFAVTETPTHAKLISKKYPAFMEYLLEMMRAKGYYVIYPSFPGRRASPLATIHSELYHLPKEFAFAVDSEVTKPSKHISDQNQALNGASTIMRLLDLFSLDLPDLDSLPLLSYTGDEVTVKSYLQETDLYAKQFRTLFGGCSKSEVDDPSADLFCLEEK